MFLQQDFLAGSAHTHSMTHPGVVARVTRFSHLCEVDGEDGVRAATGVVHAGAGCRAVDVSRLHQLLHITVVLHQVL